jgi:hypothetical protein
MGLMRLMGLMGPLRWVSPRGSDGAYMNPLSSTDVFKKKASKL